MAHPFEQPMILRAATAGEGLRVNRQFIERIGHTGEELAEQPLLDWVHPRDRGALEQILAAGKGVTKARHRTALDAWYPFRWQVKTAEGGRVWALGVYDDRFEVAEETPSQRTAPTPVSLEDTLRTMALIVEARNPGMRCSVLLVDDAGARIVGGAGPNLPDEYNQAVEGLAIGPMVGSCGTAAFWNVPVVVEDIANDALWADLRDAAALAGVQACWSHPILDSRDRVLGAMALYYDRPRAPTRAQMDGLAIAARMAGLAIESSRARAGANSPE